MLDNIMINRLRCINEEAQRLKKRAESSNNTWTDNDEKASELLLQAIHNFCNEYKQQ